MASIPYDVAEAFLRGEWKARGAFLSTGDAIYSYNRRLAERVTNEQGHLTAVRTFNLEAARKTSTTTSRHVSALTGALERHQQAGGVPTIA